MILIPSLDGIYFSFLLIDQCSRLYIVQNEIKKLYFAFAEYYRAYVMAR